VVCGLFDFASIPPAATIHAHSATCLKTQVDSAQQKEIEKWICFGPSPSFY
jgi:hypothetical protein